MRLLGVDGCRAGWVVAESDFSHAGMSSAIRFRVVRHIREILDGMAVEEAIVAIDIPIGLPEDAPRLCDVEARRCLGWPRSSSVFPAPTRAALEGRSYAEACALNRSSCGKAIPMAPWNILGSIREVDEAITPRLQRQVYESHPEVAFAVLSGGRGIVAPKRQAAGERERRELLQAVVPQFNAQAEREHLGRSQVRRDDILDAAVCLAVAHKIVRGEAMVLPRNGVPLDRRGLRMEIVA